MGNQKQGEGEISSSSAISAFVENVGSGENAPDDVHWAGLDALRSGLKLSATSKGENVIVTLPKDRGLFLDGMEPAPGIVCTSPVHLAAAGERGREAADYATARPPQ